MTLPEISEAAIRRYADGGSFERGEQYYRRGAVVSLLRRDNALEADVEGSEPAPYHVQVTFDGGGITTANCTCPYDWGGWCKHIVAALLAYVRDPAAVEERPPLADTLAVLTREQLQALVLYLVEREPHLADTVESRIAIVQAAAPAASTAEAPPRKTAVDPAPFRRQVRSVFRSLDRMSSSEAYWHVGGVVSEVRRVLEQAWAFVKADDGANALAILAAITEEYLAEWEMLDDSDGEASAFFEELGSAWTEALLSADLTARERQAWARKLTDWQRGLDDYGVDEAFGAAIEAAEQGWDDPALLLMLRGEEAEPAPPRTFRESPYRAQDVDVESPDEEDGWNDGEGGWEDVVPLYAYGAATADDLYLDEDELTHARLNVLERRGRYDEYLNLARATGQVRRYTAMLARLDRPQEAVAYALERLTLASDALAVATALRERGELDGALRVAEHGLSLQGPKAQLAGWLCELAAGTGRTELALQAAEVAFREDPSLASYRRIQELAGDGWPQRRETLLGHLRRTHSYYPQAQVDIFLHEGLIDDAIAAVDKGATHTLVEQVVEAAMDARPDWVIKACRAQADPIMDEGRAQYYDAAARWLARAAAAYRAAGREAEWRAYRDDLLARHARKYKLMPLLKRLP